MYKIHIKPGHEARVIFCMLGFKTFEAFINVCMDIDNSIDYRDCSMAWHLGVLTADFELKIVNVIEQLKNE